MTLTKSIYSHTTGKQYGAQYEAVMLITKIGDLLIVEGVNGRFPVHSDHVTDEVEQIEPEPEKVKVTRLPAKKSKAAVKIANTLFD